MSEFPISLNEWVKANKPDDQFLWEPAAGRQLSFMSHVLSGLVQTGLSTWDQDFCQVIGTHRSKSVLLPVYQMTRKDLGLTFTLRGNFYNWKLSVESAHPIFTDLIGLCNTGLAKSIPGCYFEGFPENLIFGSYTADHSKFSVEIQSEYALYAAVFLMLRARGAFDPEK